MSKLGLLKMFGDDGKYLLSAKEVAKHHNVTENAVLASRRAILSKLDVIAVFDLVADELGVSVRDGKNWIFNVKSVAEFNEIGESGVYQARSRGCEKNDKCLFFHLLQSHYLNGGVCGEAWMIDAYVASGIAGNRFCVRGKKQGDENG